MTYHAPKDLAVGHIHLKVSNLDRSIAFYRDVLGLDVMQRHGDDVAFLSAGGYHHHVALNTWYSGGAGRAPKASPGLFHAAFVYPTRRDLAQAVQNALDHGVRLDGASDHGVSNAIYFDDPDGNGIELYWDRDRADWPKNSDGSLDISTRRLDLNALLESAKPVTRVS